MNFYACTTVLKENKLREAVTMLSRIHYLGNVISSEGIVVDIEKVEDIMEFHASMNVLEVHSFMGLVGYYRGFFEDRKSDYRIVEEQEVCVDREMRGSISKAQGVFDDNANTKSP
jgi:hypothetical protein